MVFQVILRIAATHAQTPRCGEAVCFGVLLLNLQILWSDGGFETWWPEAYSDYALRSFERWIVDGMTLLAMAKVDGSLQFARCAHGMDVS